MKNQIIKNIKHRFEQNKPTKIKFDAVDNQNNRITHIIICHSNTSFEYTYKENNKKIYHKNEKSLINTLKSIIINDNIFGLKACQSLYDQTIPIEDISTFYVTTENIENSFKFKLPKYEATLLYENGNIINNLTHNSKLGLDIDNNFIIHDKFYNNNDVLYCTLFLQAHKNLSKNFIIIGTLQNEKSYLAYSKNSKTIYMLTNNQAIQIAESLQDFVSKLKSNKPVLDDISTSQELSNKINKLYNKNIQSQSNFIQNGFFSNYPDCMYSIERSNNIWILFFSERGHVFNVTAFSHSQQIIEKFKKT